MRTVEINVLRTEAIGNANVNWYNTPSNRFAVNIEKTSPATSKNIKEWEFEASPVSEAISMYWFDYVVREIKQHAAATFAETHIPEVLLTTEANDAENMLHMVMKHL